MLKDQIHWLINKTKTIMLCEIVFFSDNMSRNRKYNNIYKRRKK